MVTEERLNSPMPCYSATIWGEKGSPHKYRENYKSQNAPRPLTYLLAVEWRQDTSRKLPGVRPTLQVSVVRGFRVTWKQRKNRRLFRSVRRAPTGKGSGGDFRRPKAPAQTEGAGGVARSWHRALEGGRAAAMFSAKQLADFGYKTFSCSMMFLTVVTASIFTYGAYQSFVESSEMKKRLPDQPDQPASP
ncbi:hypothetical protein JRQ81_004037 [Phrynocephalus forsythii]|uniref:Uncharacterized protein n=1 Tax=Phrynocephalus forsythii TaxID=171643 RepID=A0A9Q0XMV8_9SAUR|nr:hypothetical protein JRQ81_004037 [Phrynocephalus forsythii]